MDWLSLGFWVLFGGSMIYSAIRSERARIREHTELSERRRDVFRIDADGVAHHRFTSLCVLATYLEEYAARVRSDAHEPAAQRGGDGASSGRG